MRRSSTAPLFHLTFPKSEVRSRLMAQTSNLKAKLLAKIEAFRPRTIKLTKEFGNVVIDKVNIGQCIGGARDVRSLVTDISYLDPFESSARMAAQFRVAC